MVAYTKALYGPSGSGKSIYLKQVATEAFGAGVRVVVLDYGRSWLPFAAVFDGAAYLAEGDALTPSFRDPDAVVSHLQRRHLPLVFELERATAEPGALFGKLCDFLRHDEHPHLLIVDEVFNVGRYRAYADAVIQACGNCELLASGQSHKDLDWLKALRPDLAHAPFQSKATFAETVMANATTRLLLKPGKTPAG